MIGIENKDSSFFTIESPDVNLTSVEFEKNLISLTIKEQMDNIPSGTLQFNDPNHIYSRILRTGANLVLSWGYKKSFASLGSILEKQINPAEISGDLVRRGLSGFVSSPSGGGSANGVITYNCNFTSYEFRGLDKSRYFTTGTKKDVISSIFNEFGISAIKRVIDFKRGSEQVTTEMSVRQDETSFRFLSRLAREWKAMFQFAYASDGSMVGIFIDPDKLNKISMSALSIKTSGLSHVIGYKGDINNIKSYTWSSNESENGTGDNVQMVIVDGQPTFIHYVAKSETITSYRLRPDRIQQAIKDAGMDGVESQSKFVKDLLSVNDFESIKYYFDPISSTTAPQGFGYRIKANMIGNPLFVPPNLISFNNGLPDRIGNKDTEFYLNSVTHTINRSGYNMSVEIVDVFSLSDIGQALL